LRVLGTSCLAIALIGLCAPASAGDALPENGAAKLAAYQVCHPLAVVDMGIAGSESSTECNGIIRTLDGQRQLDNLSIRCLEDASARPEGYKYIGTCVQTDGDGDKIFMTYDSGNGGQFKWIGGSGKFKDVSGSGKLGVVATPGNTPNLFAYTLNFDVTWTNKPK
jgi:succinate dehydrogenase/fumarate reductase flavoprotein subunit